MAGVDFTRRFSNFNPCFGDDAGFGPGVISFLVSGSWLRLARAVEVMAILYQSNDHQINNPSK